MRERLRRWVQRPGFVVAVTAAALLLAAGAYTAMETVSAGLAWRSVERVSLELPNPAQDPTQGPGPDATTAGESPPDSQSDPSPGPNDRTPPSQAGAEQAPVPADDDVPTSTSAPRDDGGNKTPLRDDAANTTASPQDDDDTTPPQAEHNTPSPRGDANTTPSPQGDADNDPSPDTTVPPLPTESTPPPPEAVVLVGTDSRSGLDDLDDFGDFDVRNADVILVAIRNDRTITLLSVPRDLWVGDSCRGGRHRIGEAMAGCGDTPGLAVLVGEVAGLTGVQIDHAAAIDLAGFEDLVDELGGYEICTEYPLRDAKSGLALEAGCTLADGATTLAWLRSRHTQRMVGGRWETLPAVSDLTRNERQRAFMTDMFHLVAESSSPRTVLDLLKVAAPHLIVDDGLSLREAAVWGWRLRSAEIQRAEIPVVDHRTPGGAAVLLPTVDVPAHVSDLTD